jgi:RNA polymerase sigma-70 factor (ECF subfamily)
MNQRAAIVLRYAEDLSTDEIADILGCDTSTVRVHLHRGRKALGLTLREEVDDVVG